MTVLGTAKVRIETDNSGLDKGFADAKQKAQGLGSSMQTALGTAAGFAAAQVGLASLSGGFSFLVGNAADFEQALDGVQAATGATEADMASMRTEALRIGKDTAKSASEAVVAMGELAKAGMSVETILNGGADAAVNLALATGIEVPQAAILVSNALNTFKADGLSAADAANIFAKAANASAIDVNDLGMSLAAVGPVASADGLSMQDFAVAMGIMGNNAMRGSDAGTSLKAMLAGLTPVSDKAKDSMQELGFNAFDAAGNFKSMPEIIANLQQSMAGLTEQQRATTLELWFGSDGLRAANIFLKEGVTGWDGFTAAMAKAPDVADQAAMRMGNFKGQLEQLKGSLETISITIGTVVLPLLTAAAKAITEGLNFLIDADYSIPEAGFRAIGDALAFLGSHQEILLSVGVALGIVFGPAVLVSIALITAAIIGYTISMAAAAVATLLAIGPWLLVIAALAGLVYAIIYAVQHWDLIKAKVTEVANIVATEVVASWEHLKEVVSNVANAVAGAVSSAWRSMVNTISSIGNQIVGFVTDHWKTILVAITGPLGLILIAIIHNWDAIWGVISSVGARIGEQIATDWNAVKDAVTSAVNAVSDVVSSVFNTIRDFVTGVVNAIANEISASFNHARDDATNAFNYLRDQVNGAIGAARDFIVPIVNEIERIVSSAFSTAALAAETAFNYLKDRVVGAIQAALDYIRPIAAQISSVADGVMSVVNKVTSAVGTVTNAASSVGGAVFGTEGWAGGGMIRPGDIGWVGEEGRELAVGTSAGTRILNHEDSMAAGMGEGGVEVNMPNATIIADTQRNAERGMQRVGWGLLSAMKADGAA